MNLSPDQVIILFECSLAHLELQVIDVLLHLLVDGLPLANLELGILHPLLSLLLLVRQQRKVVGQALGGFGSSTDTTFLCTCESSLFVVAVMVK